jgi:histidinol-phosphatase (PHP family)
MRATCARAVQIGLRSLAFTEHADFTPWQLHDAEVPPGVRGRVSPAGTFLGDPLDVEGYLECLEDCRRQFPELRILSGVELSEPHWHPAPTADLLARGDFDRCLGSVHALPDLRAEPLDSHAYVEVVQAYEQRSPIEVVRAYLIEVAALAASDQPFTVLAHLNYPLRFWPATAPLPRPEALEDEHRAALEALAASGRALEVNTNLLLAPRILQWWREVGGEAVSFGSDAHEPDRLAREFHDTAAMVAAHGFRPGPVPYDPWGRG